MNWYVSYLRKPAPDLTDNPWRHFWIVPILIKCNQDKKMLETSLIFFKKSTVQMFGYTILDAGWNISRLRGVMASLQFTQKPMRHWALNKEHSGRETILITIMIIIRTTQKRQESAFTIVLAIVLPPRFLMLKIQCPCIFYVNWKNLVMFVCAFQVIQDYSREGFSI